MKNKMMTMGMIGTPILVVPLVAAMLALVPFLSSPALAQEYAAVVVSVDSPEGCLRIRSGPSTAAPIIGCSEFGSKLRLTGIWSGRWAEISRPVRGWVYGPQIEADYVPPVATSGVVVVPPAVEYVSYPFYTWGYGRPFRAYRHLRRAHKRGHYRNPHRKSGHRRRTVGRSATSYGARRPGRGHVSRSPRSGARSLRIGGSSVRTFSRRGGATRSVTRGHTRVGRTGPRGRRRR